MFTLQLRLAELTEATFEAHTTIADAMITSLGFMESEQNNFGSVDLVSSILHGACTSATESTDGSPVLEAAFTTALAPDVDAQIGHNGASKADSSSLAASTPVRPTQTRRTSGLTGPKVVVNKPGISVYKGRNSLSLSSPIKAGPEGDSLTFTPTTTSVVSSSSPVAGAKALNIRPPTVTVTGRRRQPCSSIPKRSPSATRNGHESPSTATSPQARSALTGIRVPSGLPRQTLTK